MQSEFLIPIGLGVSGYALGVLGLSLVARRRQPSTGAVRKRPARLECPQDLLSGEQFGGNLCGARPMLDPDLVRHYALVFGVCHVSLKGDRPYGSWTRGRVASVAPGCGNGYHIFLNPDIDRDEVAAHLTAELGERIFPAEVHTFLFLHEIGHTHRAGNDSLRGEILRRHLLETDPSLRRRREICALRARIEDFADAFALGELKHWRRRGKLGLSRLTTPAAATNPRRGAAASPRANQRPARILQATKNTELS